MKYLIKIAFILIFVAAFSCAVTINRANATSFTLEDDNSSAVIDTGSQAGMFDWTVDGVNHLNKQWFWYRVGDNAEASIDTLTSMAVTFDVNFDGKDETLFVRFSDTLFTVDAKFVLTGGTAGSKTSVISEQITINNTSDSALDFHLFQYSDFTLGGVLGLGNDTVELVNANTVRETNSTGWSVEEVATPAPGHSEIAIFDETLDKLTDIDKDNLSGATSTLTGNVTWAFQWDFNIAPGSSAQISKNKRIASASVPEPATMLLLGIGLAGIAGIGMKRKKKKKENV